VKCCGDIFTETLIISVRGSWKGAGGVIGRDRRVDARPIPPNPHDGNFIELLIDRLAGSDPIITQIAYSSNSCAGYPAAGVFVTLGGPTYHDISCRFNLPQCCALLG
jgi:hypothetical protein